MSDDYYKILGITKTASDEEVKKAFRKLAHQHHPDRAGGNAEKFKKINEAYQILSDKQKRSQYDRFGRVFEGGPSAGSGQNPFGDFGFDASNFGDFGNIGDVFDAFFEGLGVKRKKKTYNRGSDIELLTEITLEESYFGASKKIPIRVMVKCEECGGRGFDEASGIVQCGVCGGEGEIRESRNTFFGSFSQIKPCNKCWGTGQIPKKICHHCSGIGRTQGSREVVFEIVPGISDGQIIKIAGAGEAGERGAAMGDLYIRIKIKPHSVFQREGDNLVIKKEIPLLDIVLNKPIKIKTISGKEISVEIPVDFSLRDRLQVAGEGMPRFGAGILQAKRGDLYIILDVKTPKKLSAKAKKLLEDLETEI